jgi:protein TonB
MADFIDILPPEIDTHRPAPALLAADDSLHLSGELKEEGVLASLIANFRDAFFPEKLPPLVLESKPIAVPDLMATKMSPSSVAYSIGFYAVLILLLAWLIAHHVQLTAPMKVASVQTLDALPPPIPPAAQRIGGGGGAHDNAPVDKAHLPKLEQQQIVPPKAPPTIPPKLAVEPSVVVQKDLKMADNTRPNLGLPSATLPGASLGNGSGGGLGSGHGTGIGPGEGSNTGGGLEHIGGGVSAPVLQPHAEPEFSEEARKAKFSGSVQVYLIVDEQGMPTHIKVVRPVGMGLDEKAIDNVKTYRFKPAMKNGKPVRVPMWIEVSFDIY